MLTILKYVRFRCLEISDNDLAEIPSLKLSFPRIVMPNSNEC